PGLGRLGDGPTAVPVLGMASRGASADVTPAPAPGPTHLPPYPPHGDRPGAVRGRGGASRDAPVDAAPAVALGITDLLTYPCNGDDLVDRVTSSMRGRRSGRGADRVEPASPPPQLRAGTA